MHGELLKSIFRFDAVSFALLLQDHFILNFEFHRSIVLVCQVNCHFFPDLFYDSYMGFVFWSALCAFFCVWCVLVLLIVFLCLYACFFLSPHAERHCHFHRFHSQWVVTFPNGQLLILLLPPVAILTESLTFCQTCTPKSCFWPFPLFTHSDSQSLILSISSLIWIVCIFLFKLSYTKSLFLHESHLYSSKTTVYQLLWFDYFCVWYHSLCISCPSSLIAKTWLWSLIWKQKQWQCESCYWNNTL